MPVLTVWAKILSRDKHSSLFVHDARDNEENSYNIDLLGHII
jgi:hypothetical protein